MGRPESVSLATDPLDAFAKMVAAAFGVVDVYEVDELTYYEQGSTNSVYRLETERGRLAAKVLSFTPVAGVASVEAAYAVERRCFEAGVLMPEPIPTAEGTAVAETVLGPTRLFRWFASHEVNPVTPAVAADAGSALASVHAAGGPAADYEPAGETWWAESLERGADLPWAPYLEKNLDEVVAADEQAAGATLVMGHGDPSVNNLRLRAGRVALIDFDYAGPTSPLTELSKAARTLSLTMFGMSWFEDPFILRAVTDGYRSAGGFLPATEADHAAAWVVEIRKQVVRCLDVHAASTFGRHKCLIEGPHDRLRRALNSYGTTRLRARWLSGDESAWWPQLLPMGREAA